MTCAAAAAIAGCLALLLVLLAGAALAWGIATRRMVRRAMAAGRPPRSRPHRAPSPSRQGRRYRVDAYGEITEVP